MTPMKMIHKKKKPNLQPEFSAAKDPPHREKGQHIRTNILIK
jgi:hypothetical protein